MKALMKKVGGIILGLVAGVGLLVAAEGDPSSPGAPASGNETPAVAPVPEGNAAGAAGAADSTGAVPPVVPVVLDDRHPLAPGDKLSFQILEDRDPPKQLTVTDSGELDVPYVGRVSVAGKTCKQVAAELKKLLEQDYYYRATVVLGLDQISKTAGRVYIWGQVRNQGAIEIPTGENFTAGKAILRAGGFSDFANKKKVRLVRTKPDGTRQTFELNMENILERGRIEEDVTLQPDDFIIVPARLINW